MNQPSVFRMNHPLVFRISILEDIGIPVSQCFKFVPVQGGQLLLNDKAEQYE